MTGPQIAGVVLVEPSLPPPLITVRARIGGMDRGSARSFSDPSEARRYGLELAERRGLLLVDLTDAKSEG